LARSEILRSRGEREGGIVFINKNDVSVAGNETLLCSTIYITLCVALTVLYFNFSS